MSSVPLYSKNPQTTENQSECGHVSNLPALLHAFASSLTFCARHVVQFLTALLGWSPARVWSCTVPCSSLDPSCCTAVSCTSSNGQLATSGKLFHFVDFFKCPTVRSTRETPRAAGTVVASINHLGCIASVHGMHSVNLVSTPILFLVARVYPPPSLQPD